MANYDISYKILMKREFYNNPDYFVHKNKGESMLTVAGLYQKWNPKAVDWSFIERVISICQDDLKMASRLLIRDKKLQSQIYLAFKEKYWNKNRLSEILNQNTANEIFISATNIGNENAVKLAQKVVNVKQDGILGSNTLKALNEFDHVVFDIMFDKEEITNYKKIARMNPNLSHNLKGWINRSVSV